MLRKPPLVFVLLFAATVAYLPAQTWFSRTPASSPAARGLHGVAYDPNRYYSVLFGGNSTVVGTGIVVLNDTWTWNGSVWTQRFPTAVPPPRAEYAMAYDPNRLGVVMHGGYNVLTGAYWGDTWLWNGSQWAPVLSAQSPPPMYKHAMAYHAARGQVILFGGLGGSSLGPQTWALTAAGWNQPLVTGGPSYMPYASATMAQDGATGGVMLYHPSSASGLWMLVGTTWVTMPVAPFDPTFGCNLTESQNGGVVAAVADWQTTGRPLRMWEWDGATWHQRATASSPATPSGYFQRSVSLAYDSQRNLSLLFSGTTGVGDTWEYGNNLSRAEAVPFGAGCGTPGLQAVAASGLRPLLGSTFVVNVVGVPQGATAFASLGLSDQFFGSFSLPLSLAGFGLPGCILYQDAVTTVPCAVPVGNTSTLTWAIPTNPSVLGFRVFLQGCTFSPSGTPGVALSNGLRIVMGNF